MLIATNRFEEGDEKFMRDYLVDLRTKQNESQQDVANALGISRQYYAMIEAGERQKKMDITLVTAIANHFGVSVAAVSSWECELLCSNPTTK